MRSPLSTVCTTRLDWTYFLYRAQHNRRRVLSFLLFAQTELNKPPASPHAPTDNYLYQGNAPGPVPQWVVLTLISQLWQGGAESPLNPNRLEDLRQAA